MNDEPSPGLVRVVCAGDSALVAEFPDRIDPDVNERATALAMHLRARWGAILRDVVVGYCTVTAYFDPLRVDAPWLESEIQAGAEQPSEAPQRRDAVVDVPEDGAPSGAELRGERRRPFVDLGVDPAGIFRQQRGIARGDHPYEAG